MTKKSAPTIQKTVTLNVESNRIAAVAHDDCLVVISVTRVAWLSDDEEERVRQQCRTLQSAVAAAKSLDCKEQDTMAVEWPLPKEWR
jgi:hypothetical protein